MIPWDGSPWELCLAGPVRAVQPAAQPAVTCEKLYEVRENYLIQEGVRGTLAHAMRGGVQAEVHCGSEVSLPKRDSKE